MSEFVSYLHEVFARFGKIQTRKMLGGHGVYHQDLMFGLVADDILYLKADAISQPEFEAQQLAAFEYNKQGKTMRMSYFAAPEEIFDDADAARLWARRAFDAALRSGQSAGRKGKRR